jgi:ABC-type Mn2+/Zn2+ transport system permease subunit
MVGAVAVGAVSVVVGLLVSFHNDTAAGATMALTAVVIFMAVLAIRSTANALNRPNMMSPAEAVQESTA